MITTTKPWTTIGCALLKGAAEVLFFGALPLLAVVFALPDTQGWLWLATLPLLYAAGCAVQLGLKPARRFAPHGSLLLIAALQAYLLFGSAYLSYWTIFLGWIIAYRGSRMASAPWYETFPAGLCLVGLVLYFGVSVAMRFVPSFSPFDGLLTGAGITSLAATLWLVNLSNLKQETLSGKRNPAVASFVLWQNRLLVLLLFVFMIIVSQFRAISQAVAWLKEQLLAQLRMWLSRPSEPLQPDHQAPPVQQPMDMGPAGPPSIWWIWLEKAAIALAYLVGTAVALILLFLLLKRVFGLLRSLYAWLSSILQFGNRQDGGSGYEDDVESLMSLKELGGRFRNRLKDLFAAKESEPSWKELSNGERIRFLYRNWVQHGIRAGYRYKTSFTPQETLTEWQSSAKSSSGQGDDRLVALYEKVRYGEKTVTESEVQEAKEAGERRK